MGINVHGMYQQYIQHKYNQQQPDNKQQMPKQPKQAQSHDIEIQTSQIDELRYQAEENQHAINRLNASIKKKREEMKAFSLNMTKLIEKNIIYKNQMYRSNTTYARGNKNKNSTGTDTMYDHPYPNSLHTHKESIYAQISKTKQQIAQLTQSHDPDVLQQIRIKEISMQEKQKLYAKIYEEKLFLEEEMGKNKGILEHYHDSLVGRDIERCEIEYEAMKKQIKGTEKQIMDINNEEIMIGNYMGMINEELDRFQIKKQLVVADVEVDKSEIDSLVQDIRQLTQNRRQCDQKMIAAKAEIRKKIKEIVGLNEQIEVSLRGLMNEKMQRQLEEKRKNNKTNKYQSTPHLPKQQSIIKKKQKPQKPQKTQNPQKQSLFPSLLLTQPTTSLSKSKSNIKSKTQLKQKKPSKSRPESKPTSSIAIKKESIIMGNWRPQNLVHDDIIKSRNISRAVYMKIRTKNNKLTGMGITYIDNVGVEVLGRSNIWKMTQQKLQEGQIQYSIDLEDISILEYYSSVIKNIANKQATKNNSISPTLPSSSSSIIGLKFMPKNGRQIKIGQFPNSQQITAINSIDLQKQYIKTVQFTLDNDYKSISGIKLVLINLVTEQQQKQASRNMIKQEEQTQKYDEFQIPENVTTEIGQKQRKSKSRSKWMSANSDGQLNESNGKSNINSVNGSLSGSSSNVKKLFTMHPSLHRKFGDVPEVDHRLLLNRKKKMV